MRREKITILDRFILESVDDRDELANIYSDVYKEKYGIRPRWMKFDDMSTEELRAELERLYGEEGRIDYEEEMSDPERDPMADFMVPIDQDFHPYETLPSRQDMGKRDKFMEAVVSMGDFKKKKDVKAYELIIGKFIATSQSGVEKLQFVKEFFDEEEKQIFDELLDSYRRAASDLSAFLRAKRLRMLK
jgi:hypothetical protein